MRLVSRQGRGWTSVCERCTSVHESLREFAGCLNQDFLDFLDLQDVACLAARTWLDERLREMYECSREFTRVCGLSESGFAGFLGFAGCGLSLGTDLVGRAFARDVRAFTRVYESLREFAGCLDCSSCELCDGL